MKDKIVSNGDLEPSRDSRVSSYEWNPWAFVPGFRQLLSVFLRDRLIKTMMETRKENKYSFNR